jgi:methanethiol S-methyltransferase
VTLTRARDEAGALALGYASLFLFVVSILILIWFLQTGLDAGPEERGGLSMLRRTASQESDSAVAFNALLILAWGGLHSLMARPAFRTQWQKILPPHMQPAVYALVASGGLILVCCLFKRMPSDIYVLHGSAAFLTRVLFWAAWGLFVYCFFHLDPLDIAGLRQILDYQGGVTKPPDPFHPTGPFLWCRHPVELAFVVAFWATPRMSTGHLLFASLMIVYTLIGIDLEDRKMLDRHGAAYLEYVKRVPQILPWPR